MGNTVTDALKPITYYLLEQPLRTLYMKGPSIKEYGFWEGRSEVDICIQLHPNLKQKVWLEKFMQIECHELIEQKFQAFYTAILIGLYFYVFWRLTWCLVSVGWRRIQWSRMSL